MGPTVLEDAGNTPEHAQRRDGACPLYLSHVLDFETKLRHDLFYLRFGGVAIAADEHRGFLFAKIGVYHECIPDTGKRFDKICLGDKSLEALHQRIIRSRKKLDHTVDRRSVCYGVRGIDDGLSFQVSEACFFQCFLGRTAQYCSGALSSLQNPLENNEFGPDLQLCFGTFLADTVPMTPRDYKQAESGGCLWRD